MYIIQDLFILLLPTAFDAAGSFCLGIKLKVSDLFIVPPPPAFVCFNALCLIILLKYDKIIINELRYFDRRIFDYLFF